MATSKLHLLLMLFVGFLFESCALVLGGTHGSIKSYKYNNVNKVALESTVNKIIWNTSNITVADTVQKNYMIYEKDGKDDTVYTKHPNADAYVNISIAKNGLVYRYEFQYVGTIEEWQNNTFSELSIAYAYDEKDNGGSEGNGSFPWYKRSLKKRLIKVFESEFIEKVDKELGVKHTEPKE